MIPVADLKSYTFFTYKFLHTILSDVGSSFGMKKVSFDEFNIWFNTLASPRLKKVNKELQPIIDDSLRRLVVSSFF